MSDNGKVSLYIHKKQILFVLLLALNLLIIVPSGWILKMTWNDIKQFQKETTLKIDNIENELSSIKIDYLKRQSFAEYKQQMTENLRYLDSKLSNKNE